MKRTPLKSGQPLTSRGTMAQVGRRTKEYESWKRRVAIPYLKGLGPKVCAKGCGATNVEVGHIKSRGDRPDLRMDTSNVEWQCRNFNRFGTCQPPLPGQTSLLDLV